jgi:hypothetical protein
VKLIYQVWAKYAYHRIGHDPSSMLEMFANPNEAMALADRLHNEDGVSDVKVIVVQEFR